MEKIIGQVKSNWSKDLIIRFLYIKLAPYFERDLLYFLASNEEKYEQYKCGFINRFPHVVCSTLSDYYVDVFKSFGINSKKIIANSARIPLFALIVEGDYGWYFLDPLTDLFNNQYGLRPHFFGRLPRYETVRNNYKELIELPRKYIDELDLNLDINFLNDYFDNLHTILTNRRDAREFFGLPRDVPIDLRPLKLDFYNDNLINLGTVNGVRERADLYLFLNDTILNKTEKGYSKVRIVKEDDNYHISFELMNRDGNIFYDEKRKNDGTYILARKQ